MQKAGFSVWPMNFALYFPALQRMVSGRIRRISQAGGPQSEGMDKFFHEISVIGSVQGTYLLSDQGEVLFESDPAWLSAEDGASRIRRTVRVLSSVRKAVFLFEKGFLHVAKTELGYLLVNDEAAVASLQLANACDDIIGKLEAPDNRKQMLLHLLARSRPLLKPQIVKALVPYGDAEVAQELVRLLRAERTFAPEVRNRLLLHVCQALGYHPSEYVLRALQEFIHNADGVNDDVLRAAREAVKQIEMDSPKEDKAVLGVLDVLGSVTSLPATPQKEALPEAPAEKDLPPITDLPEEQRVHDCLAQGEKQKGIQLLREMIAATAQKRRFREAEKLREWLIRIDSTALSDIIAAAETIESEKAAAINKDHLSVWSSLHEFLIPMPFRPSTIRWTIRTIQAER